MNLHNLLSQDVWLQSLLFTLHVSHYVKEFVMERQPVVVRSLSLPPALTVSAALERVLRLPSVCSKRFLTNKVDRCVTGLIAQQQCVGPLHTPLSDVAVTALSYFSIVSLLHQDNSAVRCLYFK